MRLHARKPISTREGFTAFAEARRPEAPSRLSLSDYHALAESARVEYDGARRAHHMNLGPYALGDSAHANAEVLALVEANEYLADGKVRPGAAIDGEPFLGKTTLLTSIGRRWHRDKRAEHGELMEGGRDLHVPVCYVTLPGDASIKGLNQALAAFYGLPGARRETAISLGERAKHAMRACGTSLVLIDDLHFIKPNQLNGRTLSDHLKNLMSEVSATFVFAGVELESAGIFGSTRRGATRNASAAQTAERLRRFPMRRIELSTADGLKLWQNLLAAIEADLRLCHHARLADPEMGEYLHARTGGSIGALIELIRMGCGRVMRAEGAVDHKQPRLTIELLDEVRLSHGTEEHAKRGPAPATKTAARVRRQRKAA